MVPTLQTHWYTGMLTSVVVKAVLPAAFMGDRIMVELLAAPRLASVVEVTVITPILDVVTDNTYFVGALAAVPLVFCSQPHRLAAGSVLLDVVWMVSVMLVRQADAAKMISETFARMV